MEKETLSSQHQLELKGHVTKMAAVSSQLITLHQRADKHELTIAGLKSSLTAKELEESQLTGLRKELDTCKSEQKTALKERDDERKLAKKELESIKKEKEVSLYTAE